MRNAHAALLLLLLPGDLERSGSLALQLARTHTFRVSVRFARRAHTAPPQLRAHAQEMCGAAPPANSFLNG